MKYDFPKEIRKITIDFNFKNCRKTDKEYFIEHYVAYIFLNVIVKVNFIEISLF